jgi:hypothetical protein
VTDKLIGQDVEGFIEIDPSKLDPTGFKLMGAIEKLEQWADRFSKIRERSQDPIERQFLAEVAKALREDAESGKVMLAQHAGECGAAKVHETEPDAKAN